MVFVAIAGVGAAGSTPEPRIEVAEKDGVFRVTASFAVAASPDAALAVLTDFERIPQFMPDVKTSQVLRRGEGMLVVEQQAAPKFMMFSKNIHLLLEVTESPGRIQFTDRCGRSFSHYQGEWTVTAQGGHAVIGYRLTARPSFEVPAFVLKRLLKRDAAVMVERLTAEIASRGNRDAVDR